MTPRSPRHFAPAFQLASLGLGGMLLTCLLLLAAALGTLLVGVHSNAVQSLSREAFRVGQALGPADRGAPAADLLDRLPVADTPDIALYRGTTVVAARGLGGVLAGSQMPSGLRRAVLDLGQPADTHMQFGGASWFVRYTPIRAPGGAQNRVTGAILVGMPAEPPLRLALQAGANIVATSLVIMIVLGASFVGLAGRLASGIASRQHELRRVNTCFETTIAHMAYGYALFDANARLIASNALFASILGIPAEKLVPGVTGVQIMQLSGTASDQTVAELEEAIGRRMAHLAAGNSIRETLRSRDNRPIFLHEEAMPDGGFISALKDLDDAQLAEADLLLLERFDRVTHLPNREQLRGLLQAAFDRRRSGAPDRNWPVVLKIDITRLKLLQDSLGEASLGRLLNAIKERLQRCLNDNEVLGRVREDEFAVLTTSVSSQAGATALAERMLAQINRTYEIDDRSLSINASIGVALAPEHGMNAEQLLKSASIVTQLAAGVACSWQVFKPEMESALSARLVMEADLSHALENGEFELFYQPLVNLKRDRVSCFEALLRWNHPVRGMIPPLDFIPLTEETGLIVPLGAWVIHRACHDAIRWPCDIRVAVNLASNQLHDAALVQVVRAALISSGLAPERLEMEVTETVLLDGDYAAMGVLHELRAMGVRISMDDFGTGHSSLSYLRDFPFDKIKIDKSFVQQMLQRADCLAIVRTVTCLAGSLGMSVTAEGAESVEQVDRLRLEGCTEVQGFYYSRPRSLADIQVLLERDFSQLVA